MNAQHHQTITSGLNWEDSDLRCAHSNKRIASAYAEDEVQS